MPRKLPALHLYTGDLWKDQAFQLCSWQAQNLWIRMLLLLHDMPLRGQFSFADGTPMDNSQIAHLCNMPITDFQDLLKQLDNNRVTDRCNNSVANRRMVRERELSENKAKAGRIGMWKRWHNGEPELYQDGNRLITGFSTYSSSSSISDNKREEGAPRITELTPEQLAEKFNAIQGVKPIIFDRDLPRTIRAKTLSRIREHPSSAFWNSFLTTIASSPFLTGKVSSKGHDEPFRATFDWVMGPKNFDKILAGTYNKGPQPATVRRLIT